MNEENDNHSSSGEFLPAEQDPDQQHEVTVRDLVELERKRIEQVNRRNEIDLKALELVELQDERQFTYATEREKSRERSEKRRFTLAAWLSACVVVIASATAGITLWMAFFGDVEQRAMAEALGTNGLIGLAGFGVISGLIRLIRPLLNR